MKKSTYSAKVFVGILDKLSSSFPLEVVVVQTVATVQFMQVAGQLLC